MLRIKDSGSVSVTLSNQSCHRFFCDIQFFNVPPTSPVICPQIAPQIVIRLWEHLSGVEMYRAVNHCVYGSYVKRGRRDSNPQPPDRQSRKLSFDRVAFFAEKYGVFGQNRSIRRLP